MKLTTKLRVSVGELYDYYETELATDATPKREIIVVSKRTARRWEKSMLKFGETQSEIEAASNAALAALEAKRKAKKNMNPDLKEALERGIMKEIELDCGTVYMTPPINVGKVT